MVLNCWPIIVFFSSPSLGGVVHRRLTHGALILLISRLVPLRQCEMLLLLRQRRRLVLLLSFRHSGCGNGEYCRRRLVHRAASPPGSQRSPGSPARGHPLQAAARWGVSSPRRPAPAR